MKKMKKIIWTAGISLVLLIVIAGIAISLFIGNIVKDGINRYAPGITKTSVTVDSVSLSLITGSASIKDLIIGNPQGYQSAQAIGIGKISFAINPATVFSHKVVIRSLKVDSANITFEGGLSGNNLTTIKDNVSGTAQSGGPAATNAAAQPASSRTFQVDDLVISNAKINGSFRLFAGKEISLNNVSVPEIHLTNLGTGPDGITAADLAQRVFSALTGAVLQELEKTAASATSGAENLGKQGLNNVKKGLGGLFGK